MEPAPVRDSADELGRLSRGWACADSAESAWQMQEDFLSSLSGYSARVTRARVPVAEDALMSRAAVLLSRSQVPQSLPAG